MGGETCELKSTARNGCATVALEGAAPTDPREIQDPLSKNEGGTLEPKERLKPHTELRRVGHAKPKRDTRRGKVKRLRMYTATAREQ
jgi:hypothetical protein